MSGIIVWATDAFYIISPYILYKLFIIILPKKKGVYYQFQFKS